MRIKLTALQSEMLDHRLTVPDALSDVLCETYPQLSCDDVEEVCDVLLRHLSRTRLDTGPAEQISEFITKEVLLDCIDGSTWVGSMIGEKSDAMINRHIDTGRALAKKISDYAGKPCQFPTC